jgi:hypothetical protein
MPWPGIASVLGKGSAVRAVRAWRAIAFVCLAAAASAAEISGISVDERLRLGTSELVLNGAGLKKQAFFRVYVASLYLTEKRTSAEDVLALGGPKRISITLLRNLSAQELVDALRDGIRHNNSAEEQHAVKGRIDGLVADLLAVQQGSKGDVLTVDWLPHAGTLVALNGELKSRAIPGEDVYRALLRVWLGENPTSSRLKRELLGHAR